MRWWWKAHRLSSLYAAAAVFCLLVHFLGGAVIPIPFEVQGDRQGVPFVTVAPLLVVTILLRSIGSGDARFERTAVRPMIAMELTAVAAVVLIPFIGMFLFNEGEAGAIWEMAARNLAGFTGYALVARRWLGERAAAAVLAGLVVACITVNSSPSGRLLPWAWPVLEAGHLMAWSIALGLLLAGIAAAALSRQPLRTVV